MRLFLKSIKNKEGNKGKYRVTEEDLGGELLPEVHAWLNAAVE